jgi:hypothetical protein
MANISGQQLLGLLQSGEAVISEDQATIIRQGSNEVLAHRVARNSSGTPFFQTPEAEMSADCVKVCLSWEWDEKNKVNICVEVGCQETPATA